MLLIEGDIFKILEEPTIPNVRGLKQLITIGIGDPFEEMLESDIGELGILLDGVPRSAFRKCKNPKCEKLFIHLSRKPKVFCSSSCAYTFLSRQRRDRIKKKIKKEGR